jgi:hypothetical protein
MKRWIVPIFLPLVGTALVLAGVILGGQALRSQLRQHDRYTTAFADIECAPPDGMMQAQFLEEVRRRADLPERLPVLDEELAARLKAAFAQHPWVEEVEEVRVGRDRKIDVRLCYRRGALAIPLADGTCAVDGNGVLLPATASVKGLPVWRGPTVLPGGKAGDRWGDAALEGAAQVAGLLRPHQEKMHLAAALTTSGEVILTTKSGSRILWGRPPGTEKDGEATATVKCERLLEHCRKNGDLDHPDGACEHDVRAADKARVRPLRVGR